MQGRLNAFTEIEVTRDEVERTLKKAADLIRTRVDYKFILILLFLKKLSDEWWAEYRSAVERLKKEGLGEEEAKELARMNHRQLFEEGVISESKNSLIGTLEIT